MRQPEEFSRGGARRFKVQFTKMARFASVVATAGKPEVYLPLLDPTKDRSFMRAVREKRVLSVRQEPTSKRQDFGVVGFDPKPHTAYLIFPRPLTAFADARVVGIKYEVVSESSVVMAAAPKSTSKPKARTAKAPRRVQKQARPPKPPKLAPQAKDFRVRVRVTSVTERTVTVKAGTKAEAKKKAHQTYNAEEAVKVVDVEEA
jgi:hypothetical protein